MGTGLIAKNEEEEKKRPEEEGRGSDSPKTRRFLYAETHRAGFGGFIQ